MGAVITSSPAPELSGAQKCCAAGGSHAGMKGPASIVAPFEMSKVLCAVILGERLQRLGTAAPVSS